MPDLSAKSLFKSTSSSVLLPLSSLPWLLFAGLIFASSRYPASSGPHSPQS